MCTLFKKYVETAEQYARTEVVQFTNSPAYFSIRIGGRNLCNEDIPTLWHFDLAFDKRDIVCESFHVRDWECLSEGGRPAALIPTTRWFEAARKFHTIGVQHFTNMVHLPQPYPFPDLFISGRWDSGGIWKKRLKPYFRCFIVLSLGLLSGFTGKVSSKEMAYNRSLF